MALLRSDEGHAGWGMPSTSYNLLTRMKDLSIERETTGCIQSLDFEATTVTPTNHTDPRFELNLMTSIHPLHISLMNAAVIDEDKAHAMERRRRKERSRPYPGQLQEYASIWHGLHLMHKGRGTTHLGGSHVDLWAQGAPPMPSLSSTEPMLLKEWKEKAKASMQRFEVALLSASAQREGIDVSDLSETSLSDIIQTTRGPSMQMDAGGLSEFDQQLMQLPDLGDLLRTLTGGSVFNEDSRMDSEEPQLTGLSAGADPTEAGAAGPSKTPSLDIVPILTRPEEGGVLEAQCNREEVRVDLRSQLFDTWKSRMSLARQSLRSLSEIDASLRGASEKSSRARLLSQAEKELIESEGKLKRRAANLAPALPFDTGDLEVESGELLVDLVIFFPSRSDNAMYEMRVLGSTKLSAVRESIRCVAEVNLESTAAKGQVSRKAYFFIEGSFYAYDPPCHPNPQSAEDQSARLTALDDEDDYDLADLAPLIPSEGRAASSRAKEDPPPLSSSTCQQDYVRPIIDLCCSTASRPTHFDIKHSFRPNLRKGDDQLAPLSFQAKDVCIADLTARLSNCPTYLFGHIGSCEHLVMIRDVRLHHPQADPPLVNDYPFMLVDKVTRTHKRCELCEHNQAECVVHDDPLAPHNPYFSCQACFSMLHTGAVAAPKMRTFPYAQG